MPALGVYVPPVIVRFGGNAPQLVHGDWNCQTGPGTSKTSCGNGYTASQVCGSGCNNVYLSSPYGCVATGLDATSQCNAGTNVGKSFNCSQAVCCSGTNVKSTFGGLFCSTGTNGHIFANCITGPSNTDYGGCSTGSNPCGITDCWSSLCSGS